jgi:NAD(P)-dependent dehydrogenase (short-subunit alcohol dehydrogenase family)
MSRLHGKVAIVTGGGSGFGEAIAHGYASQGAHVIVADIAVEGGKRVVQDITDKKYPGGGSATFVEFNVTNRSSWEEGLALAKEKFGGLDIIVNNAGTTYKKQPSVEVSDADFDKIIAVNVKSIFLSVSVVMPYFVEKKAGVYLNTSSVAGTRVRAGQVWYGGTKGFVNTVCYKYFVTVPSSNDEVLIKVDNARSCGRVWSIRSPDQFDMSSARRNWTPRDVQWCSGYTRGEGTICPVCAIEAHV